MAINEWKNINRDSAAKTQQRINDKSEKLNNRFDENSRAKQNFMKGFTKGAGKTSQVKPQEKPVVVRDQQTKAQNERQTFKEHNPAGRDRAYQNYQKEKIAGDKLKKMQQVVKAESEPKEAKNVSKHHTAKQPAAAKGKDGEPVAKHEATHQAQQAKPAEQNITQQKAAPADTKKSAEKAPKKGEKGAKKANAKVKDGVKNSAQKKSSLKGEAGKQVAAHSGIVHGSKQLGKAAKPGSDEKRVDEEKNEKRTSSRKGAQVQIGKSDEARTSDQLKSLVGGESDSPFYAEEPETSDKKVEHKPIEWNATEIFSNIENLNNFNKVYIASKKYNLIKKDLPESVQHDNWRDDTPLSERIDVASFVNDTKVLLKMTRDMIARKDARGIGTVC